MKIEPKLLSDEELSEESALALEFRPRAVRRLIGHIAALTADRDAHAARAAELARRVSEVEAERDGLRGAESDVAALRTRFDNWEATAQGIDGGIGSVERRQLGLLAEAEQIMDAKDRQIAALIAEGGTLRAEVKRVTAERDLIMADSWRDKWSL